MRERDFKCPHCGELLVSISEGAQLSGAAVFIAAYDEHLKVCPVLRAEKQQNLRAWPPTGKTATILGEEQKKYAEEHPLPDVLWSSEPGGLTSLQRLARITGADQPSPLLDDLVFKTANDPVGQPSHYTAFPLEVIEIIKRALGLEGFKAYCFGNEIKYRMRAGLKGNGKAVEDIAKAMTYKKFRE